MATLLGGSASLKITARVPCLRGNPIGPSDAERSLVSASPISCNARLPFACRLLGGLFKVRRLVHPAALCTRLQPHFVDRLLEARCPVGDCELWADCQTAPLEIEQQLFEDYVLSRIPSASPTSSFLPCGVASMITCAAHDGTTSGPRGTSSPR